MTSIPLARVTTIAMAALFLLSPLTTAAAASAHTLPPPSPSPSAEPTVSWSVRPGDAEGPDGRSWVEWEGDPGERLTEYLVVDNHGDEAVTFRLSAADGYFTDSGRFNMLPSDRTSSDAGAWITLPESVAVPAKGSQIVPFEITVPQDATPGDHPAGLAASIHSPGTDTVGVESRVGFRIMTRVTGELRTAATAAVSGSYTGSLNPFEAGSLDIAYEVTNTGNTRLRTEPRLFVTGPFTTAATEWPGEDIADIAPGETRTGTIRVSPAWPLVWYDARVEATPAAVSDKVAIGEADTVHAAAVVIAPPWSQLATLAAAAFLLAWYLRQRRHGRQKTTELIEAARKEGHAEAAAASTPPTSRPGVPPAAPVVVGLLIGATALVGSLSGVADATAAGRDQPGVDVRVEISPRPTSTAAPTPAPAPSDSWTPGPTPPAVPLAPTGAQFDPVTLLLAGTLLAAGTLAVVTRRRKAASTES